MTFESLGLASQTRRRPPSRPPSGQGTRGRRAPIHKLSINHIDMEGDIYLWQTQMTKEIRPNPLSAKASSRPDSKVDSRPDNECNLVNHPVNEQARWKPGSKSNEAAGWLGAVRSRRPCLRSVQAPS